MTGNHSTRDKNVLILGSGLGRYNGQPTDTAIVKLRSYCYCTSIQYLVKINCNMISPSSSTLSVPLVMYGRIVWNC